MELALLATLAVTVAVILAARAIGAAAEIERPKKGPSSWKRGAAVSLLRRVAAEVATPLCDRETRYARREAR
jgi:hypothetical protein